MAIFDKMKNRLPLIARNLTLISVGLLLTGGTLPTDSAVIGEWKGTGLYPTARLTYKANHTYSARMDHPEFGKVEASGVWRIEGHQTISRDYRGAESRAEILKVTPTELQIKGPEGTIWTYQK